MGGNPSKLKARTIRRGEGEMAPGLRLYRTEHIGRAAAFVLVVASRFSPRFDRRGGSDIGVERDRLLVQTDYGLLGIVWLFIRFQHILHLGDEVFIEVGHGRGRDAGRPAPPAQIPTGGTTA